MKYLPITDPDGAPLPNMGGRLIAYCAFHDDQRAQEQCLAMLLSEAEHEGAVGPNAHHPSAFAKVIERAVNKGVPSRSVAGLVTLAFAHAAIHGNEALTRYSATQKVERLVASNRGKDGRALTIYGANADGSDDKRLQMVTSRRDIERRFTEYHAIGPLMAAQFVEGFNQRSATLSESVRGECQRLLHTAWQIEKLVCRAFPHYFGQLVGIHPRLSERLAGMGGWDIQECADHYFGD